MRLGCVNGACLLLATAVAACVGAAEPPIRVPVAPVVPQPMPAPGPDAALRLAGESLYVIDSDLPVIVLASPKGLVSVTEEAGPIRIRGKFVDGLGKVESRTFKGKHVITVEPLQTGRVELLIVPQGATKEGDVIRRTLDVDAGDGPRPPPVPPDPKPPVPPDPKPKPPAGEVAWAVVVEETAQRTPATAKVIGDLAYWQGLKARGVEWRHYDKDAPEAKSRNYSQFADESGLPSLLLLTKTGERLRVVRLPATTAGIDSLLKEFGK